jgi:hypothetical protein
MLQLLMKLTVHRSRKDQVVRRFRRGKLLRRLVGRAALAMMLGDSSAGRVVVMFPRLRLRRAVGLWLALLITHAAFPSRRR